MRLTADSLVSTVDTLTAEGKTRSEICRICGYSSIKEDGTERLHFTDFYTALIEAKGISIPEPEENDYNEPYNSLCEDYSQEAVDTFIEIFGEANLDSFRDAYYGEFSSEEEFAEAFYDELGESIPPGVIVDWEATWNCNLRHDYYFEDGYVFRSSF